MKKNKFYFKPFLNVLRSDETNDICMCYEDYFQLMKLEFASKHLIPNTRRFDLKRGLFGTISDINIWTSKDIPNNNVRIFPKDKSPESNIDVAWSINIDAFNFNKMMKLKSFW